MDCVATASTLFHDLGGLKKVTERLMREIQEASKPISPGGAPLELQANSPHGTLPYQRRNLIKFLMRDVAVSCYTQQVTSRPDVSPLPCCSLSSRDISPESFAMSIQADYLGRTDLSLSS